jgi:curved DNA-binding protein CbpA
MTAADNDGPPQDLYQLLGVPREASRAEIALAWRRRARDEHPDARPADADAPGRFRALAEAWQVLGDPARRAAYDRALARSHQATDQVPATPARVPVRYPRGPGGGQPPTGTARPPLWAGPVQVKRPGQAAPAAAWAEEEIRLDILAELAWRYLGRRW